MAEKKGIKKFVSDGWINLLTGLGIMNKDSRVSTTFGAAMTLTESMLNQMYRGDGFARRVIDLVANEMVRKWIKIEGDAEGRLLKKLKDLKAKKMFRKALKWNRLHGGALIVMGIDDGRPMEEELYEDGIRDIHYLKVYDRWRCNIIKRYTDPEKNNYREPEQYMISTHTGAAFTIHESRVLRFDGAETPDLILARNNGWHDSELQAPYSALRSLGNVYGSAESIISFFETGILSIQGLSEMIASGEEEHIKTRLELLNLSKSVINTILIDSEEKFEKKSSSVRGLPDLINKFTEALSASTGLPISLLMGRAPAGLNATGEGDKINFYDNISSEQEEKMYDQLIRLCQIIMMGSQTDFKGKELEEWDVIFNPLWQLTEKEEAELRKIIAEKDEIEINSNIVEPEEVRESRYGGNKYSIETEIKEEGEREED
ncbi:MAG: DUF1073 domain-containing protein [Nanoarchaeota archaeon]|nr:DUF1073 domain-containing protein [Nanoarchaeota archaeon]